MRQACCLAAGQEWPRRRSFFKQWLDKETGPHNIIVLVDAADVLLGGGSQEQLLDNRRATVAKNGGFLVVMERRMKMHIAMASSDTSDGDAASCGIKRLGPRRCYVPSQQEVKDGRWPLAMRQSVFLADRADVPELLLHHRPAWAMRARVIACMIEREELPWTPCSATTGATKIW